MKPHKLPELKPLFLERMKELLPNGIDFQNYLDILKIQPVKSIRCNTLKISPEKLKERLESKGWQINQPWKDYPEVMVIEGKISEDNPLEEIGGSSKESNEFLHTTSIGGKERCCCSEIGGSSKESNEFLHTTSIGGKERCCCSEIGGSSKETSRFLLEPGELGRSLEHLLGYYYIQELASMLPIIALKPKEKENILDLCSAPGSKTTQIAAEMQNTGNIIANELSLGRIKILASNLERCGVTNTIITKKDGVALCKKLKNQNMQFDKILVDAPCSGEGTLRSSPKTYLMWNIKTIKSLPKIQKALTKTAFEILKINGELIYSTCTHAPEENEEIVEYMLKEFKDQIKIEKINLPINSREGLTKFQEKEYLKDVNLSCRIYPQDNNTEGFFIAKFRRVK